MKVCLHSGKAVQVSFQFDDIFDKKYQNSNEAFLRKSLHPKLVGTSPGKIFLKYLLFCYETHFVPSIVVSIQKVQQFRMVESVHDLHFTFHIFPIFFTCVQNKFGRKGFSAFTMVASPHSSKFSSRETKQMSF